MEIAEKKVDTRLAQGRRAEKGRLAEIGQSPQQKNAPMSAAQAARAKKAVATVLTGKPMSNIQHGDANCIRDTSTAKRSCLGHS